MYAQLAVECESMLPLLLESSGRILFQNSANGQTFEILRLLKGLDNENK